MRKLRCRQATRPRPHSLLVGKGLEPFRTANPLLSTSLFFLAGLRNLGCIFVLTRGFLGTLWSYSDSSFVPPLGHVGCWTSLVSCHLGYALGYASCPGIPSLLSSYHCFLWPSVTHPRERWARDPLSVILQHRNFPASNRATASWVFMFFPWDRAFSAEFTKVGLDAQKPRICLFFPLHLSPLVLVESEPCWQMPGEGNRYKAAQGETFALVFFF